MFIFLQKNGLHFIVILCNIVQREKVSIPYESTYQVFPTATGNALNQTTSTSYGNTGALFGFGTWPQSTTDANNQTTSSTYDPLGRMTGETLPGETAGEQTKQWVSTDWCSGTAAQAPCEEIDQIDRLDSSTTTRAFYDGEGRLVGTRAPGPVGQDVVIYAYFDTRHPLLLAEEEAAVPGWELSDESPCAVSPAERPLGPGEDKAHVTPNPGEQRQRVTDGKYQKTRRKESKEDVDLPL